MATKLKNLSKHNSKEIPSAKNMRFGIVVSEWNSEITNAMADAAEKTLLEFGASKKNIFIHYVPGSFELTLGAKYLAEYTKADAIICIGCVIQGETKHFDFICQGVAYGITELSIQYGKPFIFGVLTTNNLQQAKDRSGGKHGNKGIEAAVTAIKMLGLRNKLT
ncbi:MAG: 6,7-dimethyl-8-ribityllumazine synthase [Bacteroidetes bacterium RIFOXYA12_FULL_35_11]|nr:MAG: 6,7-dimethyl-8-ribityllumazine synthase [Bacteroidetes bacterium GWF2_35_48]OFY73535.1 MAG: 6,7-dimethyl-8-ribityllumazine synthase [Bacteroidetes bacterium RIFOXYA12_FULL_35_11]OFY96704.1 MAG: 6,7-dimethyl-8-ribityllumazine synthase [Bacteroidetes bacterium RIFOXYC12_FULL_35_7]HBX51068.1 6,7-dimethyl-8-ribityllumazine synthase [Bacteroidales bacterium]